MATFDDVRRIASALPRTVERLVRDRVKFNVGRIVYLALSRDEQVLGFGFPKEEREQLVAAEPDKFHLPDKANMRYQWVQVWLAAIDVAELEELIIDAWRMCVPKRVAAEWETVHIPGEGVPSELNRASSPPLGIPGSSGGPPAHPRSPEALTRRASPSQ